MPQLLVSPFQTTTMIHLSSNCASVDHFLSSDRYLCMPQYMFLGLCIIDIFGGGFEVSNSIIMRCFQLFFWFSRSAFRLFSVFDARQDTFCTYGTFFHLNYLQETLSFLSSNHLIFYLSSKSGKFCWKFEMSYLIVFMAL